MIITEETWRELQSGGGRVERKWVYLIVLVAVVVTAILCIGITYWVNQTSTSQEQQKQLNSTHWLVCSIQKLPAASKKNK